MDKQDDDLDLDLNLEQMFCIRQDKAAENDKCAVLVLAYALRCMRLRLAGRIRQIAPAEVNIWKRSRRSSSLGISDHLALLATTSQHKSPPLIDFSPINLGVIQRLVS